MYFRYSIYLPYPPNQIIMAKFQHISPPSKSFQWTKETSCKHGQVLLAKSSSPKEQFMRWRKVQPSFAALNQDKKQDVSYWVLDISCLDQSDLLAFFTPQSSSAQLIFFPDRYILGPQTKRAHFFKILQIQTLKILGCLSCPNHFTPTPPMYPSISSSILWTSIYRLQLTQFNYFATLGVLFFLASFAFIFQINGINFDLSSRSISTQFNEWKRMVNFNSPILYLCRTVS